MTKREVNTIYSFLGNGIKMSALSSPETRKAFLTLMREMKRAAEDIYNELRVIEEPAFEGNREEVKKEILNETCDVKFTKIKEDLLMAAIAESKLEVPIAAVLNSFDEIIEI